MVRVKKHKRDTSQKFKRGMVFETPNERVWVVDKASKQKVTITRLYKGNRLESITAKPSDIPIKKNSVIAYQRERL